VWDNNEGDETETSAYSFMHTYYESWPEGCTASESTDSSTGQTLYIDLTPGPSMKLAVYTDSAFYREYLYRSNENNNQNAVDVDQIIAKAGYY
jgi:hypothetical protein